MTSARGHGAIVYCLNSGSDDSQTGRHNGDEKKRRKRKRRERGARPWMEKREKPCPGWRKHDRRALVGTDGKRALKKRAESKIGVERR
ncbi:hypothetical protein TNCV_5116361 [Trichonephila clavipes]|nr:hypothetical protein TNCV_5116361 [Trichonephila clavipes]